MADPRTPDEGMTRTRIALYVVVASFLCILTISALAIGFADDQADASRLVFTSILPVIGTWVGTVLAFYFARENLEAATSSTLALAGGRETPTLVTKVMIPEADIIAYDLAAGDDPRALKLGDVRRKMREIDPPSRRLPIRTSTRAVLYVIHDSTLNAFADSKGMTMEQIENDTIADMVADPEYKQLIEAIGFVSETANIAEARRVMSSIDNCNDIFVTSTGSRDERATGWLTNTLLAGVQ